MRNFRHGVAASKDDERWWDFGADVEDDKED
jgi:hypothetical protein